ncbi:MAG: thioredoxin domain-containing protein [Bacteroidales bacterium]|nr:thioredoxin domain-containing protein [Bacteroidales bacterium]
MTKLRYILLITLNTIGILVSVYSLIQTERLNSFMLQHKLICDVSKLISCSTTYISEYAFFVGIPISLFAVLFFWFVLTVLVLNNYKQIETCSFSLLGLLNIVALLICLCYLYILLFILRNICISCLLVDLVVLLNCILLLPYSVRMLNRSNESLSQFFLVNKLIVLSFILLFVTGLSLYKVYQVLNSRKNIVLLEMHYSQEPVRDVDISDAILWGNAKAKNEIIIFNDFLCEYCKIASKRYRQLVGKDDPNVKISFISYPLHYRKSKSSPSMAMNVFVSKIMLAARNDKEFWRFHDVVIEESHRLDSIETFILAEQYLNDFNAFMRGFFSPENDSILVRNIIFASKYSVSGTPTIYINNREFQQWTNIKLLRLIIKDKSKYNP